MRKMHENIGQLFILGFAGEEPPTPFLDFAEEAQIGGFILFEDNCRTHLIARENVERLKACFHHSPPFVAIDQEGGRVCRLRGIPAEFRAASVYAEEGSPERFREDYSRAMLLLNSLGINLNLAPVADIYLNAMNTCLRDRCFGRTAEQVAEYVRTSVMVTSAQGMLSCVKHFPGLGAATVDPHDDVATADYDELIWRQREKIPFAAGVESGADLIMTTHLLLPRVDKTIVTGSPRIVSEWLRRELEFDGPIITDDLCMEGAATLGHVGERTVAAFRAGHDLLLFGQDYEKAIGAYDYFVDAVNRGEIGEDDLRSSLDRVAGIKFKLKGSPVR
jgi:beta-N-acetylhexosaminidase